MFLEGFGVLLQLSKRWLTSPTLSVTSSILELRTQLSSRNSHIFQGAHRWGRPTWRRSRPSLSSCGNWRRVAGGTPRAVRSRPAFRFYSPRARRSGASHRDQLFEPVRGVRGIRATHGTTIGDAQAPAHPNPGQELGWGESRRARGTELMLRVSWRSATLELETRVTTWRSALDARL